MVRLVRKGLWVHYYSTSSKEVKIVEDTLSFWVEGAEFSPKYRQGIWDGFYKFYEKRFRRFAYGMLSRVVTGLTYFEVEYQVVNDFKPLKYNPQKLFNWLYEHQREAFDVFAQCPYGRIKIPTRGGKTLLPGELIRLQNFDYSLFVTDSQLLFDQATDDLSKHLGIPRKNIGAISGDQFDIKPVTVAMIQTMQSIFFGLKRLSKANVRIPKSLDVLKEAKRQKRSRKHLLLDYLKKISFLCVDECHEYASNERFQVVHAAENVVAAMFLSATTEKSESEMQNHHLENLCGPELYEVLPQTLKDRGILAQEEILLISLDHRRNRNIEVDDEDNYLTLEDKIICLNEKRNTIIINLINMLRQINLKTLVLFSKVKHGEQIQQITNDDYVTNHTPLEIRKATKNRFLKKKGGVLLATNIFNKGITLPEVQVTFIAGGGREQSRTIQQKGRTLGVTAEKKKALIIDFVDISSKHFNEHSLSRISVYEKHVGIDNITIFDAYDKEFYYDIREYLSVWKRG